MNGIKLDKFDTLRNHFDACMTLYQEFIKQAEKSTTTWTVGISEVKTTAGGTKRKSETLTPPRRHPDSSAAWKSPIPRPPVSSLQSHPRPWSRRSPRIVCRQRPQLLSSISLGHRQFAGSHREKERYPSRLTDGNFSVISVHPSRQPEHLEGQRLLLFHPGVLVCVSP